MSLMYVEPPAKAGQRWTRVYPDGVRILVLAEVDFDSRPRRKHNPPPPPGRIAGHWLHSGESYTCKLPHLLKHFELAKVSGRTHIPAGGLLVVQRAIEAAQEAEAP
jgi:hypothetical protein